MKISYNWLQELLPEKISVDELSNILTSVGLEVESVEEVSSIKGGLKGLVVGKILTAIQHPNADRLRITTVDVGQPQPLQIVCGAPNAATGLTVIVALPGNTIYPTTGEPITIQKGKIRGEVSNGMICGEDEISLGTSHAGIVELPNHLPAGSSVAEHYNISSDMVIEIGLTPNRMDAMSHMGVAKDVCAYLSNKNNKPYIQVVPNATVSINTTEPAPISITIKDTAHCKRYAGLSINNITVKDSPEWLQTKLKAVGVKPINNIVDITNYVLQECGQPLHAFDAKQLQGNAIVVDSLPQDTIFTTLDGKEIKLQATDLMICDAEKGACIAGVYGGQTSGVSNTTTNIFLESAYFDNKSIRNTSMHHGLRTEAAIRFEKGVDVSQTLYAIQRAAVLILEHAGGEIVGGITDVYPTPIAAQEITVTYNYINKLSGANYSTTKIKNILLQLCFAIKAETAEELTLIVPYAKPDVTIPADVVEEIMRIDGLDNVPFTGKIAFAIGGATTNNQTAIYKNQVAQMLVGKGLYELFTNSITHSAHYTEQEHLVKMLNNLSAELDTMRPSMLETGLNVLIHNINRKQANLQLFELGKVYSQANGKYVEEEQLSIYLTGKTTEEHWQVKQKDVDIYYAKSIAAAVVNCLGIAHTFILDNDIVFINKKKTTLGTIQVVDAAILKKWDIKQSVYFINFNWAALLAAATVAQPKFAGLPKHPFVRRDLALVLDKHITYNQVQQTITKLQLPLLQSTNIFDVFESDKLGVNKKSYAISLTLGHVDKTLTDAEIEADVTKIITALEKSVGASIRG